jgi:hypothetical protein
MLSGKGRHEISKTSEDFPKISVDFGEKPDFFRKNFPKRDKTLTESRQLVRFCSRAKKIMSAKQPFF